MSDRHTWVICYDVESDRARGRVSRHLEQKAARVQKSIFEARLDGEQAHKLFKSLAALVEPGDSIRMYALPPSSVSRSLAHGGAPLPEDGEFFLL